MDRHCRYCVMDSPLVIATIKKVHRKSRNIKRIQKITVFGGRKVRVRSKNCRRLIKCFWLDNNTIISSPESLSVAPRRPKKSQECTHTNDKGRFDCRLAPAINGQYNCKMKEKDPNKPEKLKSLDSISWSRYLVAEEAVNANDSK